MFDGHGFGFGGVFMWLFWIALIVAIVWAVKAITSGRDSAPGPEKTPLDILQERLARGEIDEEEFERKRKLLQS